MARPSKYDPNKNYTELADKYLETVGREQTKLPKLSEFCREYVGVRKETIDIWLGKNSKVFTKNDPKRGELSDAIKRVQNKQKEQLMDDGLYGGREVNSVMAIFLLKVNHDMIETERKLMVGTLTIRFHNSLRQDAK